MRKTITNEQGNKIAVIATIMVLVVALGCSLSYIRKQNATIDEMRNAIRTQQGVVVEYEYANALASANN